MVEPTDQYSISELSQALQNCSFDEAEEMLHNCLARYEKDPVDVRFSILAGLLGSVYIDQGNYDKARTWLELTLARLKRTLGAEHSETASTMFALANLHTATGQYAEAESYSLQSLALVESAPTAEFGLGLVQHADQLASLYIHQGKYLESKLLCERVLSVIPEAEQSDVHLTGLLITLAITHAKQGNYNQAEPLLELALSRHEKVPGLGWELSRALCLRAQLYCWQGKYAEAEVLINQCLSIRRAAFGLNHLEVAETLDVLTELYIEQKKYSEGESACKQALLIKEDVLGFEHPDVAETLNNLACLYLERGDYEKASPLLERALIILRKKVAPNHPMLVACLEDYDRLLALTK